MGKNVVFLVALLAACAGLLYVGVADRQKDDSVYLYQVNNSEHVGFVLPTTPFVSTSGHLFSYNNEGHELYGSTVETEVSKLYAHENLVLNALPSGKNIAVEKRVTRTVSSGATLPSRRMDVVQQSVVVGEYVPLLMVKTKADIPSDKLRAMSIISATSGMSASLPMFAPVTTDGTVLPPPPRTTYENDQLGVPLGEGCGWLLLLALAYVVFIRLKQI